MWTLLCNLFPDFFDVPVFLWLGKVFIFEKLLYLGRGSDLLIQTDSLSTKAFRKKAHCGKRKICNFNQDYESREDW
jgi:hypothetical protein